MSAEVSKEGDHLFVSYDIGASSPAEGGNFQVEKNTSLLLPSHHVADEGQRQISLEHVLKIAFPYLHHQA